MADGNAQLLIVLEAQSKKLQNQLVAATRTIDRFAAQTERRFDQMNAKNAASFDKLNASVTRSIGGLGSALAPLLTALGTREIVGYADAWTTASNKIAAAGQVAGREGRSLESLNLIATDTRTGIAETTDLYAKLLRSTKDVAKSEEEVARATSIVNKAFKAGGAATSEQIAGILQLSQGLGSGILQGDELRSLRENAPLLADAIAKEFGTTIAGLKQLGAEGKLTSDRVFQAILNSQAGIEAAFGATNATIGDSFTKVNNALTQYIGTADQSRGAGFALQQGLNALADNFDVIADAVVKVAAVIAAALVGRAIGGMVVALGAAGVAVAKFVAVARTAQGVGGLLSALGGVGAAAGPIGAVVGTLAAGAVLHFATQSAIAAQRTAELTKEMEDLGFISKTASDAVDAVTGSVDKLSDIQRIRKIRQVRDELDAIRNGQPISFDRMFASNADLKSLPDIAARASSQVGTGTTPDGAAYKQIAEISKALQEVPGYADTARQKLAAIGETDVSKGVLDLSVALDTLAVHIGGLEGPMLQSLGDSSQIDETKQAVASLIDELLTMPGMEFVSAGQIASLKELQLQFLAGEKSADDVKSAISNLASLNPSFMGIAEAMNPLLDKLSSLITLAASARAQIAGLSGSNTGADIKQFREADAGSMIPIKAGQDFEAEAARKASLSKDEKALEDQIADVKKRLAQASGAFLSDAQITAIAKMEIDGKSDRKSEGKKAEKDDYEKEVDQTTKRKDALLAETAAQAELNPLVNDYGFALEKAKAKQDLLAAAQAAGLKMTPDLAADIDRLSTNYANASVASEKLGEAQDELRDKAASFRDSLKDVTRGFIDDLVAGKSAAEALGNALTNVGNRFLDMGLDALFGTGSGSSPFGLLGNLFPHANGGIAANGKPQPMKTFARGGTSNSAAIFAEAGPEAAVPLPDGRRIPVDLNMPQSGPGGGAVNVSVPIHIDATGADAAGLVRVQQQLAQIKAELPGMIIGTVRKAKTEGKLK